MKYAVVCLLAAAFAIALALPSSPASAGEDGLTLYTTYCMTCHGEKGLGDGPAAVALEPKPASFGEAAFWEGKDDTYLKKAISEGGVAVGKSPLMAAWGAVLDGPKVDAIVAHMKTLKPSGD